MKVYMNLRRLLLLSSLEIVIMRLYCPVPPPEKAIGLNSGRALLNPERRNINLTN